MFLNLIESYLMGKIQDTSVSTYIFGYLSDLCRKSFKSQEGQYQQFGCWIPWQRIYEMMMMLRSTLISFIDIMSYVLF